METLGFILTVALILAWLVSLKVAMDRKQKLYDCRQEKAELEAELHYYQEQLNQCLYAKKDKESIEELSSPPKNKGH